MARIKRGVNAKKNHKKVLKQAKGYYGSKSKLYKVANQAVMKSLSYAYVGRKLKKIARINAAARLNGMNYSTFISGLKKANVEINRKMLSEMAISDPKSFSELIDIAKNN